MHKQRIVRCRLGWFDGYEIVPNGNTNRFDGLSWSGRIPVVLGNDSETETHRMVVEVLRYGMMVVLGPR